jgi:predicted O-methyltransferase YrrM
LLRERVGAQGGVVGIEESPEMAAVAREHIAEEGITSRCAVTCRGCRDRGRRRCRSGAQPP